MADESTLEERNAAIVVAMWQGIIYEGDREAVFKYIHPDYIQHNVNMPSGREHMLHLVELIRNKPKDFTPPAHKELVRTVAQGDYVVTIWEQAQPDPTRPGETYLGHSFDMYRLEDGLIMEHWDDTRKWPRPWTEEKAE
jgi:predicted SnoaL-like aldol condensation-catalyzing enzyme